MRLWIRLHNGFWVLSAQGVRALCGSKPDLRHVCSREPVPLSLQAVDPPMKHAADIGTAAQPTQGGKHLQ